MSELVSLERIPALIQYEIEQLASITTPAGAVNAERRAAAIADLAKRAGLAVPVQNQAVFLRASALELLSVLVDADEKPKGGRGKTSPKFGGVSKPDDRRVAEGRALARTGAVAEAKKQAEKTPDKPVSMDAILKQAKRREREATLQKQRELEDQEAREAIAATPEKPYSVVVADVKEWRPAGVGSIITDPPYIGDSLPLYELLRDFAVDVLPDGAPLVVMTWQAILPGVIRALEHAQLAYRWCICWRFANTENTADHTRRVFDCWKPVLVYHKGAMPKNAPMLRDEISNKATDKTHHEWGQSVAGFKRLVNSFSSAGDIVCDPFVGGGTTAIAALGETRRFVGCDTNAEAVATTLARLEQAA